MSKEELIDKIEYLVEEYFEDNDEDVSECYTLTYPGEPTISINVDFSKY